MEFLFSSSANLSKGIDRVGGMLNLAKDTLVFIPNLLNTQKEEVYIGLNDIKDIQHASNLELIPNAISIRTKDHDFNFVVHNRKEWRTRIIFQIKKMKS